MANLGNILRLAIPLTLLITALCLPLFANAQKKQPSEPIHLEGVAVTAERKSPLCYTKIALVHKKRNLEEYESDGQGHFDFTILKRHASRKNTQLVFWLTYHPGGHGASFTCETRMEVPQKTSTGMIVEIPSCRSGIPCL